MCYTVSVLGREGATTYKERYTPMHDKFLHIAYNLITGEVLMTTRGNHLKRWVARNQAWDIAHGYDKGKWVFAHGADCQERIAKKVGGDR